MICTTCKFGSPILVKNKYNNLKPVVINAILPSFLIQYDLNMLFKMIVIQHLKSFIETFK